MKHPEYLDKLYPDNNLQAIVGTHPITRWEATKLVWNYIKTNNLVSNKVITSNNILLPIFNGESTINQFEIPKFNRLHLSKHKK